MPAPPASASICTRSAIWLATPTRTNFAPADGAPLAPFAAGSHVDLILPNGVRRSYSLCNPQGETHRYVVGVKKASPSRGASVYLHEQLRVGDDIEIGLPRNNFPLFETAPHSVLIAGGIGITPSGAWSSGSCALGASLGAALREPDADGRGVRQRAQRACHAIRCAFA